MTAPSVIGDARAAEEARNTWIRTPRNRPEELENWQAAYALAAGERPPGSVAIQPGA